MSAAEKIPPAAWFAAALLLGIWYLSKKAGDAAKTVATFAEDTRQGAASKLADAAYSAVHPNEINPTAPVPLAKGADGKWHAVPAVVAAASSPGQAVGAPGAIVLDQADPAFDPGIGSNW